MLSSIDRRISAGSSSGLPSLSPSSDSVTTGVGVSPQVLYRPGDDDREDGPPTGVGAAGRPVVFGVWARADPNKSFRPGRVVVPASLRGIGGRRPVPSRHGPLLPRFPAVTWPLVGVVPVANIG
jgi:hypothetical protein